MTGTSEPRGHRPPPAPGAIGRWLLLAVSTVVLYLGFHHNAWHVAHQPWFERHEQGAEGKVVGRMVRSRAEGVLSGGAQLCQVYLDRQRTGYSDEGTSNQYLAYLHQLPFTGTDVYRSQSGGQGLLFSVLDRLLPGSPRFHLRLFRALTALLTALAVAALVGWFHRELGPWVATSVLASGVLSQWLAVYGRNLFWSTWAMLVPMLAVIAVLRWRGSGPRPTLWLALAAGAGTLLKCLINGFEYITPVLVALLVPVAYHAVAERAPPAATLRRVAAVALGATVAVGLALGLLCVQIGAVDGDLRDGTDHITTVLCKRTHADPATLPDVYRESLEAPLPDVLRVYLLATYYDLDRLRLQPPAEPDPIRIRYSHLLVAFTALSLALLVTRLWIADPRARRRRTALAAATTVALLGPASWFLVFQAHAAAHGHLDNLVWHLPYVFFGFAAGALVLRDLAVGAWLLARRLARRG